MSLTKRQLVAEIKSRTNLGSEAIYKMLKDSGEFTKTDKTAVANLYQSHVSVRKIADQFGISPATVYCIASGEKAGRKKQTSPDSRRGKQAAKAEQENWPTWNPTDNVYSYFMGSEPLGSVTKGWSGKGGMDERVSVNKGQVRTK